MSWATLTLPQALVIVAVIIGLAWIITTAMMYED
jgi:multisubunit Na+/H+ antiporter MnhC subunit